MITDGHSWHGNVRELKQAVRRAVALGGRELFPADFGVTSWPLPVRSVGNTTSLDGSDAEKPSMDSEREAIASALRQHGSLRSAAAALGCPKSTLADRARALGISVRQAVRS